MRAQRTVGIALLLTALIAGIIAGTGTSTAQADTIADHGTVVGETPRLGMPEVLDGIVWASIQVQDRVIVGGDFTQVEDENGVLVNQPYLFAYDINTGALIDDFDPVLDGEVRSLEPNADRSGFYLGGRFRTIDGAFATRVGEIDYFGEHNPQFAASADAQVGAIAANGDTVFLGGRFNNLNGEAHVSLGAVDATTGANVPGFNIGAFGGGLGKAGSDSVRSLDINADGDTLLVVHTAVRIGTATDTVANTGAALIDIPTLTVTDWQTDWYASTYTQCSQSALQLRDGEFSPDGSFFVLVQKGNWKCDDAIAFSSTDDGAGNDPMWVTKAFDSVYSVGITDAAVYIGGHFCFVQDFGAMTVEEAVADPWMNKPEACESLGGNDDIGDLDARYQLAALDPTTGAPLDWEPVTNSQEAVFELTPIDRGLLLGHDRDLVGSFRVGRHAFFDFGGTTPGYVPPAVDSVNCIASVTAAGDAVALNWEEIPGVSTYTVRRDGSWVATDDILSYTDSNLADGTYSYLIRYRVAGEVIDEPCNPASVTIDNDEPADGLVCETTVGAGGVTIEWNDIGEDTHQVRKNGSWIAETAGTSYVDATGTAADTYQIRYRTAGVTTTVDCN